MPNLQLFALIRDGITRAASLRERQDALQDDLAELKHPEVPSEDPAWDDDGDRWELGPAVDPGAVLVPSLDDDQLASYWPGN
jgi:hypothetical protein